jgi:hypothetical protein
MLLIFAINLSIEENPPFYKGGQKPPQVHPRNILPIALGNNMNRDANTEFLYFLHLMSKDT